MPLKKGPLQRSWPHAPTGETLYRRYQEDEVLACRDIKNARDIIFLLAELDDADMSASDPTLQFATPPSLAELLASQAHWAIKQLLDNPKPTSEARLPKVLTTYITMCRVLPTGLGVAVRGKAEELGVIQDLMDIRRVLLALFDDNKRANGVGLIQFEKTPTFPELMAAQINWLIDEMAKDAKDLPPKDEVVTDH